MFDILKDVYEKIPSAVK